MTETTIKDDFLSELTRKKRRDLLGVSMVGIVIAKTGLIPTEISALGIKFNQIDQQSFARLLSLVVLYFLVGFVIYQFSDFLASQKAANERRFQRIKTLPITRKTKEPGEEEQPFPEGLRLYKEQFQFYYYWWWLLLRLSIPIDLLRMGFDIVLPIWVGAYAAHSLWFLQVPNTHT